MEVIMAIEKEKVVKVLKIVGISVLALAAAFGIGVVVKTKLLPKGGCESTGEGGGGDIGE
jgi:hypothetical protein